LAEARHLASRAAMIPQDNGKFTKNSLSAADWLSSS
jgi:hypothetical protein